MQIEFKYEEKYQNFVLEVKINNLQHRGLGCIQANGADGFTPE